MVSPTQLTIDHLVATSASTQTTGAHFINRAAQMNEQAIHGRYTLMNDIGHGSFGDVQCAQSVQHPSAFYAVKILRSPMKDPREMNYLREYIFYANMPKHPNLANVKEMFLDPVLEKPVFIMELAGLNLLQPLDWHRQFSQEPINSYDIALIVKGIFAGLAHIHANGFVHRDIKPENILLSFKRGGIPFVKIADFGLSRRIDSNDHTWTSYVATRWYRAPEQLLMVPSHTPALDIWSTILLLCELCNLHPLFPGRTKLDMLQYQVSILGYPRPETSNDTMTKFMSDKLQELGITGSVKSVQTPIAAYHPIFEKTIRMGLRWNPQMRPSAYTMTRHFDRIIHTIFMRSHRNNDQTNSGARFGICVAEPESDFGSFHL